MSHKVDDHDDRPVHLPTLLVLLKRWRGRLAIAFFLMCVLAVGIGLHFGRRSYVSESILILSERSPESEAGHGAPNFGGTSNNDLTTHLHLVKSEPCMQRARERLGWPIALHRLESSVTARLEKDTALLFIEAEWSDAVGAQRVASAVEAAFLESCVGMRAAEAGRAADSLQSRLREVDATLEQAEQEFTEFMLNNNIVDLDKETQWFLDQYTSLEMRVAEAELQETTIETKLKNLEGLILEARKTEQEDVLRATIRGLPDIAAKANRLRSKIRQKRDELSQAAELKKTTIALDRSRRLHELGLISDIEFEGVQARYDAQYRQANDSEEITRWKQQLDELELATGPPDRDESTSTTLVEELLRESFLLQLEHVTTPETISAWRGSRDVLRSRLDRIPALKKKHDLLRRDIMLREDEKRQLSAALGRAQRVLENPHPYFVVAQHPKTPTRPKFSTRRPVALVAGGAGYLTVWLVALALLARRRHLRTVGEVNLHLRLPVLGEVPDEGEERRQALMHLAGRICHRLPVGGRLLLTGVTQRGIPLTEEIAGCLSAVGRSVEVSTTDARREGKPLPVSEESIILIAAPPAQPQADAALLASSCEAVLLFIRGDDSILAARRALDNLEQVDAPILGAVLLQRDLDLRGID